MNTKDIEVQKIIQVAINLLDTMNFDMAISKIKKTIKKYPEYVILYNILGTAYQRINNHKLAKDIFVKALKMHSDNIPVMNNLANTYKALGEYGLAENLLLKIIKNKPNYINAYVNYGNLKRDTNELNKALELYNNALDLDKKIPLIYYAIGLAHQGLGEFDKAVSFAKQALLIEPKFTQSDMLISQSTKYTQDDNHFKQMCEKIKNTELNDDQKINLYFAIAKGYEDIGNIEKAFNFLKKGNKLKRDTIKFDINNEIDLFESIKNTFKNFDFNGLPQEKNIKDDIIFILGMPRSGTTLTEQIISSHSSVLGAGELPMLSKLIKKEFMDEKKFCNKKFQSLIKDHSLIESIRKKYYLDLESFGYKENLIIDKAPLNFRWIGFIKIFFPNAKIIHCTRNPKDNCLSLYKNLFEGGLNFSYSQTELGNYNNVYLDLIDFWKKKYQVL